MPNVVVDRTLFVHARRPEDEVSDRLLTLIHTVGRFRQQVQQATHMDSEWGYDAVLFHIVKHGPARASALAESTQLDPSTVSRQVAALVRDGLVERRADPHDGRASLLHPTDLGLERYDRHRSTRDTHYREMLKDWSERERTEFSDYLARFTAAFDAYKPTILTDVISQYAQRAAGKEHL